MADYGHGVYDKGYGVEQDYIKAMDWYAKAGSLDNAIAISEMGSMYVQGNGVKEDYKKAIEFFEKAIDLGNANAMNRMGQLYSQGKGVN